MADAIADLTFAREILDEAGVDPLFVVHMRLAMENAHKDAHLALLRAASRDGWLHGVSVPRERVLASLDHAIADLNRVPLPSYLRGKSNG